MKNNGSGCLGCLSGRCGLQHCKSFLFGGPGLTRSIPEKAAAQTSRKS